MCTLSLTFSSLPSLIDSSSLQSTHWIVLDPILYLPHTTSRRPHVPLLCIKTTRSKYTASRHRSTNEDTPSVVAHSSFLSSNKKTYVPLLRFVLGFLPDLFYYLSPTFSLTKFLAPPRNVYKFQLHYRPTRRPNSPSPHMLTRFGRSRSKRRNLFVTRRFIRLLTSCSSSKGS